MILLALAFLVAQDVPPPRGPNDQVIGNAAQFRVTGPARICVGRTSFALAAGETSYLDYLGIHWGAIRVVGPHGTFVISDGNIWSPEGARSPLPGRRGRRAELVRTPGRLRYLIYGRTDEEPRERPRVFVDGEALPETGDQTVMDRIEIHFHMPRHCTRAFIYGFVG